MQFFKLLRPIEHRTSLISSLQNTLYISVSTVILLKRFFKYKKGCVILHILSSLSFELRTRNESQNMIYLKKEPIKLISPWHLHLLPTFGL